ncbi:MAG: bifunctional YncE family protein/alkaline phosphatase family protein [Acidobacteria bacterium]|nr:bifunctional YncE family protein/alkaline phosphatase family protein [Acidobacteriota bacterium]
MTSRKIGLLVAVVAALGAASAPMISTTLLGRQVDGSFLLVNHQLVKPWGTQIFFKGRPVDMAFDPSKRWLAVLSGTEVVILDGTSGSVVDRAKSKTTSYAGIAFSPDGKEIWASEATRSGPDSLLLISVGANGKVTATDRVNLPGHSVPTGIAFSADGKTVYVAMHRDNALVAFDRATRKETQRWPMGIAPFGVVVREGIAYVTNRAGSSIPAGAATAPSGGVDVPVDANGSVLPGTLTILALADGKRQDVQVDRAPSGLAMRPDGGEVAVANGHSDTVTLVDTKTKKSQTVAACRQPIGVLYSADGNRLYVACAGDNAVGIVEGGKVIGALPTGWFPSALALDSSGDLRVVNIKGVGNTEQEPGKFNSRAFEGSLLTIPAPSRAQAVAGQREVKLASEPRFTAQGGVKDLDRLGIEHVFLLIKENRTYDQVFGDMPVGNGKKEFAIYPREITPNHHALAEEFVLLDNFYASGAISFEGHQWLMMGFVSDHVERALQAAPRGYAWNMADGLAVSPQGFFWQSARRPLKVQLLGALSLPGIFDAKTGLVRDVNESDLPSWNYYWDHYQKGTWRDVVGSKCGVPSLKGIYDERFPPSEMKIPDAIRAEAFLERLGKWEKDGTTPNLTIVTMTSDHTVGKNPGAPTPRAMVADNDLALGRMVEGISKSKIWGKSLILVVEDDAQDGVDHVAGNRTVALAIGPHIKRKSLNSNFFTQTSLVRTIQDVFRIEPKTQFLKAARAMNSVFVKEADLKPFTHVPAKVKLDELNPPLKALKGRERWAAEESAKMNWSEVDDVPTDTLNRILWGDAKGYATPYPGVTALKR